MNNTNRIHLSLVVCQLLQPCYISPIVLGQLAMSQKILEKQKLKRRD